MTKKYCTIYYVIFVIIDMRVQFFEYLVTYARALFTGCICPNRKNNKGIFEAHGSSK